MATYKLTDGYVKDLAGDGRDRTIWDAELPRFGLRITPAARKLYVLQYRAKAAPGVASVSRKVTIGEHDGNLWNVTKARAQARKVLGAVDAVVESRTRLLTAWGNAAWAQSYVDYVRWMDHLEGVAPRWIHHVAYEALIEEPKTELLRIAEFGG